MGFRLNTCFGGEDETKDGEKVEVEAADEGGKVNR
jgi:hypothetical protein